MEKNAASSFYSTVSSWKIVHVALYLNVIGQNLSIVILFFFAGNSISLCRKIVLLCFGCQVDSLIELKEHEDLSLADEADRNWVEVIDHTYIFNRKRREVSEYNRLRRYFLYSFRWKNEVSLFIFY